MKPKLVLAADQRKVVFLSTQELSVFTLLTFSPGSLQHGGISDGPSPPLRLLEVSERVLDQRHPKALLHSLPGHSGAHPAPLERAPTSALSGPLYARQPTQSVKLNSTLLRPGEEQILCTVRTLSVRLTEYRTLSSSGSVNSPYSTPTAPFLWRDGSASSFSIPGGLGESVPQAGVRMAVQTPLSLLWDPLTDSSSFSSPQSLPSDWRRNGSDGAGEAQLTALFLLRNEANLPTTDAKSFFVMKGKNDELVLEGPRWIG
ncbi:hypothetical protein F7725_003718 [Dissostichus mawsoni]|uniref:Uncharacterized protein n=1 Tax=Dissostichus mawsoni TaxID=36200 RepID=A0A7J5YB36_DISMA|nr:hypothetical protein F7725_003718 [Dissostichus mawsoni]